MSEISLELLKEKIIKTDVVISLLAEKNEKISQLREKLRALYHKYVNKLKECEVLQMKIDLCKLEHDPLVIQLKEVTERYEILVSEHKELANTAQIRYQSKCQELDLKIKECEQLLQQKDQWNATCNNENYETVNKKLEKENKQVTKLTNKCKNDQELIELRSKLKELTSEIKLLKKSQNPECSCLNDRKMIEIEHSKEVATLQDMITKRKLSELKLQEEIAFLKTKISLPDKNYQNYIVESCRDMINISQIEDKNEADINMEYELIRESIFEEINMPIMLLPLSSPIKVKLRDKISDEADNISNYDEQELTETFNAASPISDRNAKSNISSFESIQELTESSNCAHNPIEINADNNTLLSDKMDILEDEVSGQVGKKSLEQVENINFEGKQALSDSCNGIHNPALEINAESNTLSPKMDNLKQETSEQTDNISFDCEESNSLSTVYNPILEIIVENNTSLPKMDNLEKVSLQVDKKLIEKVDNNFKGEQVLSELLHDVHSPTSRINWKSNTLLLPNITNFEDKILKQINNNPLDQAESINFEGEQALTVSFNNALSPISETNAERNILLSRKMDNLEDKVSEQVDKVSDEADNINFEAAQAITGAFNNIHSPISEINAEQNILLSPKVDNLKDKVPEQVDNKMLVDNANFVGEQRSDLYNGVYSLISEVNIASNTSLSQKMDNLEDKRSEGIDSFEGEEALTKSFNTGCNPILEINAESNTLLSTEVDNLEDKVAEEADNIIVEDVQDLTELFGSVHGPISEKNTNTLLSLKIDNLDSKVSEQANNISFEGKEALSKSFNTNYSPISEINAESSTLLSAKMDNLENKMLEQAYSFEDELTLLFNNPKSPISEIIAETNTVLSPKADTSEGQILIKKDSFEVEQRISESFSNVYNPLPEMNVENNTLLSPKIDSLENKVSEKGHIHLSDEQELFKSLDTVHGRKPEINTKSNTTVEKIECKPTECHFNENLNSKNNQPNLEASNLTLGSEECIFEKHRDSSDELFIDKRRCSTPKVQLNLLETSDHDVLPCTTSINNIISTMLNENSLEILNSSYLETLEKIDNSVNLSGDIADNNVIDRVNDRITNSTDDLGAKFKIVDANNKTFKGHYVRNRINEISHDIYLQNLKYLQEIIRCKNENSKYGIPSSSMFGDLAGFLIQVDNVSIELPKDNLMDLSAACHNMDNQSIFESNCSQCTPVIDKCVIINECTYSENNSKNRTNNVEEMNEAKMGRKIEVSNENCIPTTTDFKEKQIYKNRRPVRKKRLIFNKFKSELLKELLGYVDRKIKMNAVNMKLKRSNKSIKFRKLRKLQMIRWRKLRESYLPHTDTESETFKKCSLPKRCKSKPHLQSPIKLNTKETNISTSSSEDINDIRKIFNEQRECQAMISEQRELEDFYQNSIDVNTDNETNAKIIRNNISDAIHMCNDSTNDVTSQDIDTPINSDKDSSKSIDSGYIKSDSDVDSSRRRSKKRMFDSEDIEPRKKIMQNVNNYITRSKKIKKLDNKEHIDYSLSKNKLTQEICAVLQNMEATDSNLSLNSSKTSKDCDNRDNTSTEYLKDNIFENTKTSTAEYLFGSDCESISADSDKNTLNLGKTKNTSVEPVRYRRSSANIPPRRSPRLRNTKTKSATVKPRKKSEVPSRNRKISSDNLDANEEKPAKLELTSHEDPLHLRLRQDSLIKQKIIIKSQKKLISAAYKRSNSLKYRKKETNPVTCLIEAAEQVNILEKPNEATVKKIMKLTKDKARGLFKQILTFPDKTALVDEAVEIFSTQENTHIVRLIINELSMDIYSKPDTKHTPPAPVMTEAQRILLGLLVKLDRSSSPDLLDTFMVEAEQYLFTCKILNCIENVTRLYLSICKLRKNIHRMRRIVCDAFYFMGDFSIPFLFTVLSTWIEIFPLKSESSDNVLIYVLIEIIKSKNCMVSGYNLIPLKKLLNSYYGYEMEEGNLTEAFNQIFNKYMVTPSKSVEYALLILCKNCPSTWVLEKINVNIIPFMEKTDSSNTKENIRELIERIRKGVE